MVEPKDKDGNGQQQEYNPSVEYEHVDADVWYKVNPETGDRIDVTYTKDILDQIAEAENEEDEDDESSPTNE